MGQGGYLSIRNATRSNFKIREIHSYQMDSWCFPDEIPCGTTTKVYIEWDNAFFHNHHDDAGDVAYTIGDDPDVGFKIEARNKDSYQISVIFSGVRNILGEGNIQNLGWKHDGVMELTIAGDKGSYVNTVIDFADWMQNNLDLIGRKHIGDICMPGSHNAGMSLCQNSTIGAREYNTVTQYYDIGKQLSLGTRYFDIRPTISGGKFYTGHYTEALGMHHGGNGQKLDEIVCQVNKFTHEHKELVILRLSHSWNTDLGQGQYRPFNDDEWQRCIKEVLDNLENRYVPDGVSYEDLSQKTFSFYIDEKREKGRVLVLCDFECPKKGFLCHSWYPIYDKFSNTNNLQTMIDDQLGKMEKEASKKNFLLSWTLTQQPLQAAGGGESILEMADKANARLDSEVLKKMTTSSYPNIVFVDGIQNSRIAEFCCSVNRKIFKEDSEG